MSEDESKPAPASASLKFSLSRDRRSVVVARRGVIEAVIPADHIRVYVKEPSLVLHYGSGHWSWEIESATEFAQAVADLQEVLAKAVRAVRPDVHGVSAGVVLGLVAMMAWNGLFASRAPLAEKQNTVKTETASVVSVTPAEAPSQASGAAPAGEPVDLAALAAAPAEVREPDLREPDDQASSSQDQALRAQAERQMQEIMTEIEVLRRQSADLAMENRILRDQADIARKYPVWVPPDQQPAEPAVGYEFFGFRQGSAGSGGTAAPN